MALPIAIEVKPLAEGPFRKLPLPTAIPLSPVTVGPLPKPAKIHQWPCHRRQERSPLLPNRMRLRRRYSRLH